MVGQLPEPENGLTFWDATGGAAEKFLRLVDSFTIQYDRKTTGAQRSIQGLSASARKIRVRSGAVSG